MAWYTQGLLERLAWAYQFNMFAPLATKHEVAADEAGTAGDEGGHGLAARSAFSRSISPLSASYSAVLRSR